MTEKSIPTKLPKHLYQYFWEVDAEKVNPRKKPMYVIKRLLDKAERDGYRYLVENFPNDLIKETIKKRRGFSPETANFWALFYNIPREEVVCLNKEFLGKHVKLWPH